MSEAMLPSGAHSSKVGCKGLIVMLHSKSQLYKIDSVYSISHYRWTSNLPKTSINVVCSLHDFCSVMRILYFCFDKKKIFETMLVKV